MQLQQLMIEAKKQLKKLTKKLLNIEKTVFQKFQNSKFTIQNWRKQQTPVNKRCVYSCNF